MEKRKRGRPRKNRTPDWCLRVETLNTGKTVSVQQVENGVCLCPKRPFTVLDNALIFLMLEQRKPVDTIADILSRDIKFLRKRIKTIADNPDMQKAIILQIERLKDTTHKQKDIGRVLGLSRERVRQIEMEVKIKLLQQKGILTPKRLEKLKEKGLLDITKVKVKKERLNDLTQALEAWT